jgi:hypothetical protein
MRSALNGDVSEHYQRIGFIHFNLARLYQDIE